MPVSNVDYYTCTMHPSVHLHDPKGKCPDLRHEPGAGGKKRRAAAG